MAYDPTGSGWTSQTDPEPARPAGVEFEAGPEVAKVSTSAVVTAGSGTIATAGVGVSRVAPAAAVTGVILQAGTNHGQRVTVMNESTGASSVTFATAATSNVADGVSTTIAGLTARSYVWNAVTARWYWGG